MTFSVWFEGVDDLNTVEVLLERKAGRVGREVAGTVRTFAALIERSGKQLVSIDTGLTRNTIGTDFSGDGRFGAVVAEIGPTTNYAPFLEWGTSRMPPHAFMGPALDLHSGAYTAAIEQLGDPFLGSMR